MPHTGGIAPSPERYGGGDAGNGVTLTQRVYESLAAARGDAYDQVFPPKTSVGIENLAYARIIAADCFGSNARLANQFRPSTMTADGLLPRWEKIFGITPPPSATDGQRRAVVASAFALFMASNTSSNLSGALSASLNTVFVNILNQTLAQATPTTWINGISGVTSGGGATASVTFTGVPQFNASIFVQATSATQFEWSDDGGRTFIQTGQTIPNPGTFALSLTSKGVGITINFPAGTYANGNTWQAYISTAPSTTWSSTIANVAIQLTQNVAGFNNAGNPNAAFYTLAASIGPLLENLLPAWATWNWYINNSGAAIGFKLDEPNIGIEAFA